MPVKLESGEIKIDADELRFREWMEAAKNRVKIQREKHAEKKRLEKRQRKLEK